MSFYRHGSIKHFEKKRIRIDDFTGHRSLGNVDQTFFAKLLNTDCQMLLNVLAGLSENGNQYFKACKKYSKESNHPSGLSTYLQANL